MTSKLVFPAFVAMSLMAPSLMATGCAHAPKATADSNAVVGASTSSPSTGGPAAPAAVVAAKSCQSDLDCGDRQLCVHSQCFDITAELAECSMFRVHFDFDKHDLHAEDQGKLQRVARCLKADQALHILITGNADERGTDEYNLSLGDLRATNVAHYLLALGVSQPQLRTLSYGKEKPLCVEHDEACWAENRRASVRPSGGR